MVNPDKEDICLPPVCEKEKGVPIYRIVRMGGCVLLLASMVLVLGIGDEGLVRPSSGPGAQAMMIDGNNVLFIIIIFAAIEII
jgi:hypothetical protein